MKKAEWCTKQRWSEQWDESVVVVLLSDYDYDSNLFDLIPLVNALFLLLNFSYCNYT